VVLHHDLVDEVAAQLDSPSHTHAFQLSGQAATDLLDVSLQIPKRESGFGPPGQFLELALSILQPLLYSMLAGGQLFKLDHSTLVCIEKTLELPFAIPYLTFKPFDLLRAEAAVGRDLVLFPPGSQQQLRILQQGDNVRPEKLIQLPGGYRGVGAIRAARSDELRIASSAPVVEVAPAVADHRAHFPIAVATDHQSSQQMRLGVLQRARPFVDAALSDLLSLGE